MDEVIIKKVSEEVKKFGVATIQNFLNLTNLELVDRTRWFSYTKRVSKYCIEGERGFVSNCRAGEIYLVNVHKQLKDLGWI